MSRKATDEKNTVMGERIKALRQERGITQEQLGKIIGVQKSAVTKYEKGEIISPPTSTLTTLANYFNVSIDYLLNKTEYRNETERRSKIAEWDEKYNKDGQLTRETTAFEKILTKIPMFSNVVSAGYGTWLGEGYEYEFEYLENVPSGTDFALRVRGDSMEPMYSNGDIVFVKANVIVESGQIGVFCLNDEGYLKMLQGNKLVSLNPKYKPITVNEFDTFYCAGRVIGKT